MKHVPRSFRIIIPAYNAAETLPIVLDRLKNQADLSAVLVVNDGSTDATESCAERSGVRVIRHPENMGKGAALKSGIREALLDPAVEAIVTMDADGQHDPADLEGFVAAWAGHKGDLLLGDRQIRGSRMPLHRRISNLTTSSMVSLRTRTRVPDSQCGYRLMSRRLAESVHPESNGFEAETEWILRAAAMGFVIGIVPVRTLYGPEQSHMKNWETTKAFVRVFMRDYTWVD